MLSTHNALIRLPGGREHIIGPSCAIGRSSGNHVVLDHASISRRHALIHLQGEDEHWLVDLGSSNGTRVNNKPVVQPARLSNGDEILLGDIPLLFCSIVSTNPVDTIVGPTLLNVRVTRQWLMVADIEGYTPLSRQLGPEALARTIGSWFAASRNLVEESGGDIHKYLGDGWLAGWLDEAGSSQRVMRCIKALHTLQQSSQLPFRFALHHGEVTSSGSSAAGDLGMMGADVNFVFRMEKVGATLGLRSVFSQKALSSLGQHSSFHSVGQHALKGYPENYEFFTYSLDL